MKKSRNTGHAQNIMTMKFTHIKYDINFVSLRLQRF